MNRSARTADQALRDEEADALFSGLENSRGLILAVSGGPNSTALLAARSALGEADQARAKARRGNDRSRIARGSGARSGCGEASCPAAGRNASHSALARQKTESRIAGGRARRPLSAARGGRRRRRLRPYPDRAHARRSGGNGVVPAGARQRTRGTGRHGPCLAAAGRSGQDRLSAAAAACPFPKRGLWRPCARRASPTATIRATAIRALPAHGCAP